MPTKKEQELEQLKKALMQLEGIDYSIVDDVGESPDFIINVNSNKIGVELTSVFRALGNGSAAKTQSDLPKIAEDAVEYYNKKNNQSFVFSFVFQGNESIISSRNAFSKILGKQLVEWENQINIPVNSSREIDLSNASDEIKSIVSHIFVEPCTAPKSISSLISGFKSKTIESSEIERAIRKKEKLIEEYKNRCSTIWLLVVLPSMMMAADYKLDDVEFDIPNKFDKVYVFDEYRSKIIEIQ